jgi:hypothetical protein
LGKIVEKNQEDSPYREAWVADLVPRNAREKGNEVMKKSLLSALGLALALVFTMPILGTTSANAAPMKKHHRHHHHRRHHHRYHNHHHHHRHHHKKPMAAKY